MKNKMNEKIIEIGRDDYYVKVSWAKDSEKNIKIYAKLVPKDPEKNKKKYSVRTKTAKNKTDIEEKILEAAASVKKQLKNKRNNTNPSKHGDDNSNHPLVLALKVVESLSRNMFPEWEKNTFHSYFTYMMKNAVPELVNIYDKDDFNLEDFKTKIRTRISNNKNTIPRASNIERILNGRIVQFHKLYKAARSIDSTLVDLDFGIGEIVQGNIGREQIKRLPTEIIRNFRKKCIQLIDENVVDPKMIRAAVIFESAGTRTGEAAGIIGSEMIDFKNGMLIKVLYQDNNGIRDKLKNKYSYRNVVVDYYARCILTELNERIGAENKKISPVNKKELSSFIIKLLRESGLTEELETRLKIDMNKDPDYNPQESEDVNLTSYVMRRNRASVWTDCCGYTEAEVDASLGHDTEKGNQIRKMMFTQEFINYLSKKNELFNPLPEYSLHPAIRPISIDKEKSYILNTYNRYRIMNDSNHDIKISINIVSNEPGEDIELNTMGNAKSKLNMFTDGQAVYKRRKDYIIGCGTLIEEEMDCGREDKDENRLG